MKNKPNSYRAILSWMTASSYYCGDPVGKCLKHASIREGKFRKRIDLCIKDSDTYAAFLRKEKIGDFFNKSRAVSGQLRWRDCMRPEPRDAPPHPIFLDVQSGIFCDSTNGSFGCASDVRNCFFVRAESGEWEPFFQARMLANPQHLSVEDDIARAGEQLATVDETSRSALIEARRGQGQYRRNLIAVWGRCAVTRCAHVDLLRASHIKPWRDSSNKERLDKFNGLLLTPNLDAAFDRGLISFADDGHILIMPALSAESRTHLGISSNLHLINIYEANRPYLVFHRKLHGF